MDGCSCSCIVNDGWDTEVWTQLCRRLCRSGQVTKCPACGGAVDKGDQVMLVQGGFKDEETGQFGRLSVYHYHPECLELIMAVANKHLASWMYGCEIEDECLDDWVVRLDLTIKEDQLILEHASKVIERMNA